MDYHQRTGDDDYSTLTFNQPLNSLSLTSSTISILDSTSKTTSLMMSKQSNINVDHLRNRTRSLRKRQHQQQKLMNQPISSYSTTMTTNISSSTSTETERQEESLKKFSKIQKQEARPLGTCVRKCGQCRQMKHVLLAECTICFRMMDVDLKDCKCQILTSKNVIENFICSICNSELTLDGYIVCANRTCQTTLSALINKESTTETHEKSLLSATLTNICYPKSAHRTVAIQVNTLINLPLLQRFLSTMIDDKNEESSWSSWSKRDLNRTIITSSDSSDRSHLNFDTGVDATLNDIVRNMTAGFNSNQPTKLALQSEDELRQEQQSQISNLTNITDTIVNNNPEFTEMPKSPRCLAIMNVRKRRDRLSTLLTLQTNKTCQTQLSCLIDIDQIIKCEEISNTTIIRTNNPTKIERQIQVDTIKDRFDDLCQVRIEIADRIEKESTTGVMNEERILQALVDRDGQRWSELIDQLISEQSQFSPSEKAQQLLDTIERLHTNRRLNNLTTGQLQRKVRYAISQLNHIDEHSYLQNNLKTTKSNRSGRNSKQNTECNGRMDMAVTVRQIDTRPNHQSTISSDQNWKPYVDRLFEQGHSADEIQRLLHEAAEKTMQNDDERLQDVFNYIHAQANLQRAKKAPSEIAFVVTPKKIKPVSRQQAPPTNLFQSVKPNETMGSSGGIMTRPSSSISERKVMSNEASPAINNKNQGSITEITKDKSSLPSILPNNNLIQSHIIKSDIIQVESLEKTSIIDLNEDETEQSLSMHSFPEQEHENIVANPNTTTIYKNHPISSTEITIQRERSNDKKSNSNNIVITLEQKTNQIQEVIQSKTSQASETSSSHNRTNSSAMDITPSKQSNDISLKNLEEKCIHALHSVQNTLDVIDNADVHLHPHSSNIQFEINELIHAFETYLHKPNNIDRDSIESLMAQCIEHLNNEKQAIVPQLKEIDFRNLNEKISNALNLLQEYKTIVMPIKTNNEDSLFNGQISNVMMIQSDVPVSLKRAEENIEQTIESQSQPIQVPSNTTLDLKQQIITSEYREPAGLIRCRPIPYTSSNEKRSTETLKQVLICSSEHISLKSTDPNEQLIGSKSDFNHVPDISSKTENDLYNDQSQIKWLDSLLSKMSDNVVSTSDIFSTSPSLSVIDHNNKYNEDQQKTQEPIQMEIVNKQAPSLNTRPKSSTPIHQHIKNVPEVTSDSQNILYETDVIKLEEEHAMSIIVPDQDVSLFDEQFQIVQTKILQKKSVISSKQVLNPEGQITRSHDEKNHDNIPSGPSNLDRNSDDTSQKSPFMTTSHANNFDQENQSTFSVVNNEPQLITTQSSSYSDIDLSEQLDQIQIHEDGISQERLVDASTSASEDKFESPQEQVDSDNDEKITPVLIPEHIALSKTDIDTIPETSTKSSPLNDQENEKRTTSVLSYSSDENKDQNSMKASEPRIHTEKTPNSSQANTQVVDEHASIATSKIFNHPNDINKLQLPVSTQHSSISNTIQSNSFLTHVNDQDDSISSKESISNDNPASDLQKRSSRKISSINSKDQNIVATPIQHNDDRNLSSGKIDNTVNNKFYTPIMLSPTHSIPQQPTNSILSPSRTTKIEIDKYKKLTTPSSVPLEPISAPTTNVATEDELIIKRESVPHLFIEGPSDVLLTRSATPLIEAATTDDNEDDERSNKSMSNTEELPIDDKPKEDLGNKLYHNNDELQTEHTDSPVTSNASIQESSSFDDMTHTPPSLLRSNERFIIDKADDQQSKTRFIINRRFSPPKIAIEDVQTPLISTLYSSVLSTTSGADTHMKSKQQVEKKPQSISEDTESLNVLSSTKLDKENQSNTTPVQSIIKEKSSSNESTLSIALGNTAVSEHSTTRYDKSEENPSIHSSFQSEQSRQDEDHQSKKKHSLRMESLIKLLPSPPDNQSMEHNHSETKDSFDQIRSSYLIEREDKNKDRLDDQKSSHNEQQTSLVILNSDTKRVESSSPMIIKRRPVTSTVTAVLPSSVTIVNAQEQYLKSQISPPESKHGKFKSDNALAVRPGETQGAISVSSFNLDRLTDLTPNNRHETNDKKLPSQSEKSLPDDNPHQINSKQQSSSTNSLIRGGIPSSSMQKLLLKRSSIKQMSTIAQSIKPSATSSITDVSTSSSHTVVTDHLLSTHSTISDQVEVISLKKVKTKNSSKGGLMAKLDPVLKRNILRKTSRPSQNQSFISSNQKEQPVKTSKKKFLNNNLLTNSELTYDTEPGSDAWIKSHEDINQILIVDKQDGKKRKSYERQQKKQTKNRIINGPQLIPFNLKARSDHQAYTVDSSRLPSIEQSCGEHHMKKSSNDPFRRPIIRLPVTQIEKFECGTIGPHLHPSSIVGQFFPLPSIHDHHLSSQFNQITESFTDRVYSLMSSENNDDKQAFESILNWQHQPQIPKVEQNKFQYMYLLDTSIGNSVRGKQYPILTDEIDMIDDPNACTIINKWAFADLVHAEREKFIQESINNINKSKKRSNLNKNIKIYLRKRPLTEFEENVFKEVDIISIVDSQTILLHIPSITVDNQVFIKNRKFKCDQTFNEHCQISTIYHSTLAPLLDMAIDDSKCLCLIGGGKYSGKTYLLHSLMDFFALDLNRLLSTYDIYVRFLGICHNRIVDILQNYSPIRLMKSMNWTLIPNEEFHLENDQDIDYIKCQIKKRRRFIHQLIQINFRLNNQSTIIGSLMIVILASSQYVYTRNLCSHRRKFLINSLNKTILSFKRALLGIRQNPDRIRTAFNNDILTRLIQPYVFHNRSNICYIGTLNPGHRHRIATKSTLEFARNLRFCLKRINKQRRQRKKLSRMNSNNDELYDHT